MRSEEEVIRAIRQYSDTVKRICLVHLKNSTDTEDVFQDVFLKYALCSAAFESPEHEKAWLIRVTMNACKDFLKRFFRNRTMYKALVLLPLLFHLPHGFLRHLK